ncbi:iron chelate uptake ABC transporter family permease subunit [Peribacillus kribbensis]|uniref:iron chelate uptake ABC transporter family permease subunit n=1 Tax=Peribacillus kribbensis TaxID=356658 RepID=UPI000427DBF6|nr:iron chelate uptake ABC transporter family permease subunit [Peribacillus kribbensis]
MHNNVKLILAAAITLILVCIFLFTDIGNYWGYVVPKRLVKIAAIVLTGTSIALSTVIFQTVTNNRILTPSIIGLDSLYILIQTVLIFVFGTASSTVMDKNINFVICICFMILFALGLFKVLFQKDGRNIYFLLLAGMVMGILFQSFSSFMQVIMDPNDFMIIQDRMFASFNNINTDLLLLSSVLFVMVFLYSLRFVKYLDVLSLGRDSAVNLGVDYHFVVKRLLIVVAVLVSISTSLVGPITFLGLLVANTAYQFLKTYRHSHLLTGSILISIMALTGGLLLVERVFTFSTTISVIINFAGGVYFLYLLLKERKA